MPAIAAVRTGLNRIALPGVPSDGAHGRTSRLESVAVRIVDGFAIAPARPGHGIEPGQAAPERTRPA